MAVGELVDRELSHQRERVVARPPDLAEAPGSVTFSAHGQLLQQSERLGQTATSLQPGPRGPPSAHATTTDPASRRSQPATMAKSVVLPEPDRPATATTCRVRR
jgi:hypothetical protein